MKASNYSISGHIYTIADTGANSVKARKFGKFTINFSDGIVHELFFPCIHIKGTTFGTRTFNFKHVGIVADKESNLASFIHMNPDERTGFGSLFSSKQKTFPDTFRGDVMNFSDIYLSMDDLKHTKSKFYTSYAKISGEWTSFLNFDENKYWSVNDYPLIPIIKQHFTLPSDSSFRKDVYYWKQRDEKNAQTFKEEYEEIQRTDRKLREKYKIL